MPAKKTTKKKTTRVYNAPSKTELCAKIKELTLHITELEAENAKLTTELKNNLANPTAQSEKLIKSYAQRALEAERLLNKATYDYNTRTQFMLDCVRHCYTSMQLAAKTLKNPEMYEDATVKESNER